MSEPSAEYEPVWFAQIGDAQLKDSQDRVLLFTSEEEAVDAGVAEWGAPEYVFAVEARFAASK